MKEDDLKKVQELALKQLLNTNEAQSTKIEELQREITLLKNRLGFGSSHTEVDILQLIEQNKILSNKLVLLESEFQRLKPEIVSDTSISDETRTSETTDRIDLSKRLFYTAINSLGLFIIAYAVLFLLYHYVTLNVGQNFGLHGVLHYWGIEWPANFDITFWNSEHIVQIFISGSIVCLIVGIFFFVLLKVFGKIYYKIRLFMAWLTLLSFNYFFGSYIAGTISGEGFAYVQMALGLEFIGDIFIMVLMMILMYILGAILAKPFLFAASSFSLAEKQKRFLIYQVLYPSIAGNILILMIKIPGISLSELLNIITMYIMILPMFYTSSMIFVRDSAITFQKNYRLHSFNKEIIVGAFILLIAIRFFFK